MSREYFSGGYFGFAGGYVIDAEDRDFFLLHGYVTNIAAPGMALDPAKTSSLITLSNGNLTANKTAAGAPNFYASSLSFPSGGDFLYVETVFDSAVMTNIGIGVSNATINDSDAGGTDNWIGWDANSIGLWDSTVYCNGAALTGPLASIPDMGDVIGIYLDRTGVNANQIWFLNVTKNEWSPGTGDGHSIASLGAGPLYFGFTFVDGKQATVNFDGPFVNTFLGDYTKWDGTPIVSGVTHYTLTAEASALTLTGIAAGTQVARKLIAASGAFALTGIAAVTRYAHKLIAVKGDFVLTGAAAILRYAHKLIAARGAFTLTGVAAITQRARKLVAASRAFTVTGIAANLVAAVARRLLAETGALVLTGNAVNLVYTEAVHYTLAVSPGIFVLSDKDATLSIMRAPRREILQFGRPVYYMAGRW